MFVAWRDLRHARGRFALMISVIALITLLVAFLAALTAGLGRASTSAITDLPADRLVFAQASDDSDPTFTQSQLDQTQWEKWSDVEGVTSASALGVTQTRATADGSTAAVTAFGLDGAALSPSGSEVPDGQLLLSPDAAEALDLSSDSDETVSIGSLELDVAAIAPDQLDFAHTPVVWISLKDWQQIGAHGGASASDAAGSDGSHDQVASVIALTLDENASQSALAAADTDLETATMSLSDARSAISSFAAENLSLTMMQGFLLAISALVVGVFFTVWTINRGRDIAVIKALGGSTRYLLGDAIGQAVVVLILGTGIGALLATGLGALASQVMPVVVDLSTMMLPAILLTVLGLVGALVAVARIGRIDPHSALAAR